VKRIGIWSEEELSKISSLVQKARELDSKKDCGRVFIARAIGAFYAPGRAVKMIEILLKQDDIVDILVDTLIDDILEVENSLSLTGKESLDELWDVASILSAMAGIRMEKVKFKDEVFSKLYVLGRLAFLLYLMRKKKNKEKIETLLPHKGKKVTTSRKDMEYYSRVKTCSTCRYKPLEAGDKCKECSHCEPVGEEGIGSNWEPMSAVEKAEMLSYYGEECDYGDIFEETVVDSLLSLMETNGGYLPPLVDEEFWAMSPESE